MLWFEIRSLDRAGLELFGVVLLYVSLRSWTGISSKQSRFTKNIAMNIMIMPRPLEDRGVTLKSKKEEFTMVSMYTSKRAPGIPRTKAEPRVFCKVI